LSVTAHVAVFDSHATITTIRFPAVTFDPNVCARVVPAVAE
jgi:hypothetical protein